MAGFQNKDSKGGFQPPLLGGFQQPGLSDGHGGFQDDTKGLWLPNQLGGLVDWHRSDMGITLVGSKVSAWADQSGQGHDLTQGTDAQRAEYVSNVIGGHPVLRGSTDFWMPYVSTWAVTATGTAFVVVKYVAHAGYQLTLYGLSRPSLYMGGNEAVDKPLVFTDSNRAAWGSALSAGTNYLVKWAWDFSGATNSTYYTQVGGGTEVSETVADSFNSDTWQSLSINPGITGAQQLECDLAELIIYNRKLAAADDAAVRAYVTARYGIAM